VAIKTRQVCTREVSRTWSKKCDESAARLETGIDELAAQLDNLRNLRRGMAGGGGECGCSQAAAAGAFECGVDGEVRAKDDVDNVEAAKTTKWGGWFGSGSGGDGDRMTRKERREKTREQRRSPAKNPLKEEIQERMRHLKNTTADLLAGDDDPGAEGGPRLALAFPEVNLDGLGAAVKNVDDSIASLEGLIAALQARRSAAKKMCANPDGGSMSKHVLNHCVAVAESPRLQERHEEKCAKRAADMLAQSVTLAALVTESHRRLALLDKLAAATEGVTHAWVDFNLTVPAFALLGDAFASDEFANVTRSIIQAQAVNESSLCAEMLPTLQSSVLGLGISKEEIWCPKPVGTFIGGRELPDWAPHFLVGVGLVLGFFISAAFKATPAVFAVMCEHPALFVVAGVVVLAGRFA